MSALALSPEVRSILERSTVSGNRLQLPPEQLDRDLYLRVAKAIGLMGGAWSKKERAHLFEDGAEEVVADAIATGTVLDFRKHFQFFETPPSIAAQLVALSGALPGMSVLEPSAGRGRIVEALRSVGVEAVACELEERNREALHALGVVLVGRDFLELPAGQFAFDRIVANPPFARGQDVAHVSHMWELIAPGGRLVSIMSPGWTYRQDRRHSAFRLRVEESGGQWEPLPAGSFSVSGTGVNAGILVVDAR